MSIRGKAAIIGIGETPHRRVWPGRSMWSLCAEAAAEAIRDAGLRREDIDGLMTMGGVYPGPMAEYIGIRPTRFAVMSGFMGASSGVALAIAANVVANGMAKNVMFVAGGARDPGNPAASIYMGDGGGGGPPSTGTEWSNPFGLAAGANTTYGLLYTRHMYEYGTKPEQLARIAVNQRFNTQENPLSAFRGQALTVDDVLNSRYINYPLHLLESVMPVAGAIAYIVSSAEHARTLLNPPVYILGVGVHQGYASSWTNPNMLEVPARLSTKSAYEMAGYGPMDIEFAEFYD
ncbi:MAG: thiolase family protein [Chloroflexi bacterium]|nr:thiolase family protein [Chloroflexota bacterium]